jgi:uncharacterized protein YhaN
LDYEDDEKDSIKVAADSLNILIDQIKEFKSKKDNLENLIMNNRGEDQKDISKNIEDIIDDRDDGRNKFLAMYVTIVEKMRKVADLQDKIEYFTQLDQERKGDLTASKNLSDVTDREEQQQKLNQQINDITENVKEMEDQIRDLEKEIAQNERDLDNNVKDVEKEFKQNIKDTEWNIQDPK